MKNLAHEAKPAREKFRGRGGVRNGCIHGSGHGRMNVDAPILCVHVHTAWMPNMSVRWASILSTHGHPAGSTIMGVHTCATWATKTATLWTSTCVSTCAHEIGRPYTPTRLHELPRLASTGTHHRPRTTTKFWTPTLHGGVPRFGPPHLLTATHKPRPPSSTACYGHPRILDSHHVIWATTESLWPWTSILVHEVFGRPCNHLGAHEVLCAPTQSCGHPATTILGRPHAMYGYP